MDLTEHEIQAFIEAWKEDFGEELASEQAESEMRRLLDFISMLEEAKTELRKF